LISHNHRQPNVQQTPIRQIESCVVTAEGKEHQPFAHAAQEALRESPVVGRAVWNRLDRMLGVQALSKDDDVWQANADAHLARLRRWADLLRSALDEAASSGVTP
jgi:hypothetical protein